MSSISSVGSSSSAGLEAIAARWKQASASSSTEAQADLFKLIDSDGDGALNKDEFDAAVKSASPQHFDMSGQSTQSFAGMRGMAPPDPIASLDTDDDGSVSSEEFGLEGASEDVQALFKAIDADGSGSLSSDEISSFRDQFMQKTGEAGRPPGPPPGPPPGESTNSGNSSSSSSADASSTSSTEDTRLRGFLQQLAEMFASQYAQVANGSGQSATTLLSASA